MKKTIAAIVLIALVLSILPLYAGAAIWPQNAVGSVVYLRYTDTVPNMARGVIDDSWGEKLIRIDTKAYNSGITPNEAAYHEDAEPEMDTYCDIWACFTDTRMYFAFFTNDVTPIGGDAGDGICFILERGNPKLTYICADDPATGHLYNYTVCGTHLDTDDTSPRDYGVNRDRQISIQEKNGGLLIKMNIPFSICGIEPGDLNDGTILNFCFSRNICSNPSHYLSGDGNLYWGKYFTMLGKNSFYVRDNENASSPNSFVLLKSNTKQYVGKKLLSAEEYAEYMAPDVEPVPEATISDAEVDKFFETVNISDWAKDEVREALKAELLPMNFTDDFTAGISREKLSVLLTYLTDKLGIVRAEPTVVPNAFNDTSDKNVMNAAALGIINGYKQSDGTYDFKPANILKRSELTAVINRVAKLMGETVTGYDDEVTFKDTVDHWCRPELGFAVHTGIVKGTSATTFSPENTLTVEQTVLMFYRTYEILK